MSVQWSQQVNVAWNDNMQNVQKKYLEQQFPKLSILKVENSNSSAHLDMNHSKWDETVPHFISWKKKKWKKPMKNNWLLVVV